MLFINACNETNNCIIIIEELTLKNTNRGSGYILPVYKTYNVIFYMTFGVCVRDCVHVFVNVCVCVCLCLAAGIRPVGDNWSENSSFCFKDMAMGKTLYALGRGRQDSGSTSVILLDTTTSSHIDKVINFELVNLNHGAKT